MRPLLVGFETQMARALRGEDAPNGFDRLERMEEIQLGPAYGLFEPPQADERLRTKRFGEDHFPAQAAGVNLGAGQKGAHFADPRVCALLFTTWSIVRESISAQSGTRLNRASARWPRTVARSPAGEDRISSATT